MPNGGPDNCMNCEHSGSDDPDTKSIRVTCSIRGATIVLPAYTYCVNFTSEERGVSGGDVPLGPIWIDVSHQDLPSAPLPPHMRRGFRCPIPDWGKYHLIRDSGNDLLLENFLKEQVEKYEREGWKTKRPGKITDDHREVLVRAVEKMYFDGVEHHADEILFEPGKEELTVNLKTGSGIHKLATLPMSQYKDISFLIKARAGLDTGSTVSQGGGFDLRGKDRSFTCTVTTEPFSFAEKIIIKLKENALPEEGEASKDDLDSWLEDLDLDLELED